MMKKELRNRLIASTLILTLTPMYFFGFGFFKKFFKSPAHEVITDKTL
ncbi:hypothetical protein R9X47_10395 [Wukongibacter baidiensis]